MEEKFCMYCGEKIPMEAVVCVKCGRQVGKLGEQEVASPIIVNNNNSSSSAVSSEDMVLRANVHVGRKCNKMVAIILCLLLGWFGGHKFYEGKNLTGIVYLFTMGFFFLGIFIDFFNILGKPNPYYVRGFFD